MCATRAAPPLQSASPDQWCCLYMRARNGLDLPAHTVSHGRAAARLELHAVHWPHLCQWAVAWCCLLPGWEVRLTAQLQLPDLPGTLRAAAAEEPLSSLRRTQPRQLSPRHGCLAPDTCRCVSMSSACRSQCALLTWLCPHKRHSLAAHLSLAGVRGRCDMVHRCCSTGAGSRAMLLVARQDRRAAASCANARSQ